MTGENIIGGFIFLLVAGVMASIGYGQKLRNNPVGFYTGEIPPKPEMLTDVPAWNRAHGGMWQLYGAEIAAGYLLGLVISDEIWSAVLMAGGVVLPLPLMIWQHERLKKKFMKS